ncbi:hypothetical protein C1N63_05025 [Pantoea ananatis]|nr:hypothetical protein C1N63_05025 [Pantoea ananatis]
MQRRPCASKGYRCASVRPGYAGEKQKESEIRCSIAALLRCCVAALLRCCVAALLRCCVAALLRKSLRRWAEEKQVYCLSG